MSDRQVLGSRYELLEQIGSGGFGSVWRAYDHRLRREVAMKLLHVNTADLPRFEREAQALGQLNHPNVVTVHDFGAEGNQTYLVLELIRGTSLAAHINALPEGGGGLPLTWVIAVTSQILSGLGAAHAAGFVHRDLKPQNIMIVDNGRQVKIVDFGIAHAIDQTRLTASHSTLGTLAYMAPEQFSSDPADGRMDLYALGCLMYEMLTGTSPYAANTTASWIKAHLYDLPAHVRESRPDVPEAIDAFVQKLLSKSPADRPANADEAQAQLTAAAQSPNDAATAATIVATPAATAAVSVIPPIAVAAASDATAVVPPPPPPLPGHPISGQPAGYASGQPASGQPASGQPMSGQPVSGPPPGYPPGQVAPGGFTPGQAAPGGYPAGQAPPGYVPGQPSGRPNPTMAFPAAGIPHDPYQGYRPPPGPEPAPRRRTGLIIGLAAAALLLLIGGGVAVALTLNHSNTPSANGPSHTPSNGAHTSGGVSTSPSPKPQPSSEPPTSPSEDPNAAPSATTGEVNVVNPLSGRCLYENIPANGVPREGAGVHLATCVDQPGGKWEWYSDGTIRNTTSHRCLAVSRSGTLHNDTGVIMNTCDSAPYQVWTPQPGASSHLVTGYNDSYCLYADPRTINKPGTNVWVYTCDKSSGYQGWTFQ